MLVAAIIGGLVLALGAGVAVWLMRRQTKPSELSFHLALTTVKQAMKAKKPTLRIFTRSGDRVPYDPRSDERDRLLRFGKYQLSVDDVIITYTTEEYVDEAIIALAAFDDKVTLSYADGELNGIWIGNEALGAESFELRQGRNAARNLRQLLRHHLGLPGGEMDNDEAPRQRGDGEVAPRKKKKRRPAD